MHSALRLGLVLSVFLWGCGEQKHPDGHGGTQGHGHHAQAQGHGHHQGVASFALKLEPAGAFTPGQAQSVRLILADAETGAPIGPEDLVVAHANALHLLMIDESLTDYQHTHPTPGARRGEWNFSFAPKFGRTYRIWADATRTGRDREYAFADLVAGNEAAPAPSTQSVSRVEIGGLTFTLAFDQPLQAGRAAAGNVTAVDTKTGQPFTQLEPIMGAFGHVVAFSRDWASIEHVHPHGTEPKSPTDRSGPVIGFEIAPKNAGVLKIFVQVVVGGRDVIVPFTQTVAP